MENNLYVIAKLLFVVLVITLFCLLMYGLHYALQKVEWEQAKKRKVFICSLSGFIAWFAFTGILAAKEFFMQFSAIPPRLPVLLVPPIVFIVWLTFSGSFSQVLRQIPGSWLMYVQAIHQ